MTLSHVSLLLLQHAPSSDAIWQFDIRHAAESAGHAAVLLSAFALTIIVLLIGSSDLRRDPMSGFVIRPFLMAFVGNLLAAFMLMLVQSDTTLSERTFALLVPPELMGVAATTMMLFGIMLAVMRQFPERHVRRQAVWLFAFFGLFSIGVLHNGLSDLLHVHHSHLEIDVHVAREVLLLVWVPGLVLVPMELGVRQLRMNPERLHGWNLWLCGGALVVATLIFGLTALGRIEDPVHVPGTHAIPVAAVDVDAALPGVGGQAEQGSAGDSLQGVTRYEASLDSALAGEQEPDPGEVVELAAVLVSLTQWLLLGSCFILLRRFPNLSARYPKPADHPGDHEHPPHPPL